MSLNFTRKEVHTTSKHHPSGTCKLIFDLVDISICLLSAQLLVSFASCDIFV